MLAWGEWTAIRLIHKLRFRARLAWHSGSGRGGTHPERASPALIRHREHFPRLCNRDRRCPRACYGRVAVLSARTLRRCGRRGPAAGRPSHPVLVTLLMPDSVPQAEIEQSLLALASSISERAQVPLNAIFINHEQAHSGRVFDAGKLVRW